MTDATETTAKAFGQRWLDAAVDDVMQVEKVWKHAIQLKSLRHGTTARFGKHAGMSEPNGWRLLEGKEAELTTGVYGVDWTILKTGANSAKVVELFGPEKPEPAL